MYKADLHIHSTVSDGSDTLSRLVELAEERELDAIAITDHDTVSHLDRLPRSDKVRVLGGVEISAEDQSGRRAHILGYNLQKPELVRELTQPTLEQRSRNSERQVEILLRHGYRIEIEKLARADGKYLYKQHIMDYLVQTGQAPDMFGGFYQFTFKNNGICAFDITYADVFEAVEVITAAGGQAVLAHSGQQQNFYLIPTLVRHGLAGLELNHHSNSEKDKEIIREYARDFGLFLTGGSDYHGRYEPQPFGIGDFLSEESGVRAICQN